MKYIRTKDNRIIDIKKYYIEGSNLFKKGGYQEYKKDFANAYKVAATIEELCDEFVAVRTYKVEDYHSFDYQISKKYMRIYKSDLHSMLEHKAIGGGDIIYGAIWTDKGLIYVAKMNDKGELELL